MHDLDLDLWNGSMSNINMQMERSDATFYLLAIPMFSLSVTVCEILTVEMCMTLTLIFRSSQGQIFQSKDHVLLSLLAIAIFVLSVKICEIITFELPNVLDSNI